jgi:hypothetical protein
MARNGKNGVNISAAVREYLKTNKDVGPTAVAEAVSKQIGKKISPIYVSNIKSNMNGGGKTKARRRRKVSPRSGRFAAHSRASANGAVELKTIVAVKELVASVGADKAHQLIDLLA